MAVAVEKTINTTSIKGTIASLKKYHLLSGKYLVPYSSSTNSSSIKTTSKPQKKGTSMQTIKSSNNSTNENNSYAVKIDFENCTKGEDLKMQDNNIIDLNTAILKANALLLSKGSDKTEVDFSIPYHGLNLGDIIKLNVPSYPIPKYQGKDRFIVLSIRIKINKNSIIEQIKAKRYD